MLSRCDHSLYKQTVVDDKTSRKQCFFLDKHWTTSSNVHVSRRLPKTRRITIRKKRLPDALPRIVVVDKTECHTITEWPLQQSIVLWTHHNKEQGHVRPLSHAITIQVEPIYIIKGTLSKLTLKTVFLYTSSFVALTYCLWLLPHTWASLKSRNDKYTLRELTFAMLWTFTSFETIIFAKFMFNFLIFKINSV